jgi:putative membrane protein
MVLAILAKLVYMTAGVGVAAAVTPGVEVDGEARGLLWIAALFGLANAVLSPLLRRLALPLTVVTLSLSSLVVNGVLLAATAGVSEAFDVAGLFATMLAALSISTVTILIGLAVGALFDEAA